MMLEFLYGALAFVLFTIGIILWIVIYEDIRG